VRSGGTSIPSSPCREPSNPALLTWYTRSLRPARRGGGYFSTKSPRQPQVQPLILPRLLSERHLARITFGGISGIRSSRSKVRHQLGALARMTLRICSSVRCLAWISLRTRVAYPCRRTGGRSEAHRPVAGDGACRMDDRGSLSTFGWYSGSGLPSGTPHTSRRCPRGHRTGVLRVSPMGIRGSLAARASPEAPVRPPSLAWDLRLAMWATCGQRGPVPLLLCLIFGGTDRGSSGRGGSYGARLPPLRWESE
jgi:hypothetical protein